MEAVGSSETSFNIYQTAQCYIQKTAIFILVVVINSNVTYMFTL